MYQEGYFLKLNDLDTRMFCVTLLLISECMLTAPVEGRPCVDRRWVECFAVLTGTVLSIWDAAALDAAENQDITPTFINLTDASIKMVRILW